MTFYKPRIIISACLDMQQVRYNGSFVKDDFVLKLKNYCEFIPICPEISINLGVPRDRLILYKSNNEIRLFQTLTNKDLTDGMLRFSDNFLKNLNDFDGFLLKAKSPSCAIGNALVYKDKEAKVFHAKGRGIFGSEIIRNFPNYPIEDEGRLRDVNIKQNFLIKVFALANLRNSKSTMNNINKLMEFHRENKYLLMAFNQQKLKSMGTLIAKFKKDDNFEKIKEIYFNLFVSSLASYVNKGKYLNVLQHIYGYFSDKLNKNEKKYFISLTDKYINNIVDLRTLIEILKIWSLRFENKYILNQTFLNPYPDELG
ncbi:protein of unknown function DUF1722 [Thermodesulfobium narugense DSM 14796]|uniref:DUF1722 domain-containing protein n=1 Tax=Thermodesulfobium narugense DSM 14796 TaxID=747365 RepID=M1E7V5_9BACT|nr:DUF523 and DUF1722 domain-containing protein [Thermodesulfobium narugense]AEE14635.1 protein of unknown function DUF1722 [Thermodesulfobium narugense DSM 14796]